MGTVWTTDSVLALAPDPESAKAGRGLAGKSRWSNLGANDAAVWGEIKGSGSTPYQTRVDLNGPAFKCSCPSRKFPCKHGIALLLTLAQDAAAFTQTQPPGWVTDWLASRAETDAKKAAKAVEKAEKAANAPPPDPTKLARKAEGKMEELLEGLEELEKWMHDLVREGFHAARSKPFAFWDRPAARLMDAKAQSLARMVRGLSSLVTAGSGDWAADLLQEFGRAQLLVEALRHRDRLPAEFLSEVRHALGVIVTKEELALLAPVRDAWQVVGQTVAELDDGIQMMRTWLWGMGHGRPALVLSFRVPVGSGGFGNVLPLGRCVETNVTYFPGVLPLRGSPAETTGSNTELTRFSGAMAIADAQGSYRRAMATVPWLTHWPMLLEQVRVFQREGHWFVRDEAGHVLPLSGSPEALWQLLGISRGGPIPLFGVWSRGALEPLGTIADGKFLSVVPPRRDS